MRNGSHFGPGAREALTTMIVAIAAWGDGSLPLGGARVFAQAPSVVTDKPDYLPSETVTITGSAFAPNTLHDVPVIRPDGSIVTGDGSFTPGWDTVLSNAWGGFTYLYQLNGIEGTYEVRVYASPWSGNLAETPLASTTFTDGSIDWSQCQNDSNNDNVADACSWAGGAINGTNSVYAEGDAVPQRLFHQIDDAGTHTMRFDYDFSSAGVYAYDFLSNVDQTMSIGPSSLNECGNLPGFVSAAVCSSLFSGAALSAIPSDPFDSVSLVELASRNFRVGCSPACSGSVTVSFPSLDGVDDPGEGHVPDTDPDCFKNCGNSSVRIDVTFTTVAPDTIVAVWFGGHLARGTDPDPFNSPPDGWGTGCGTAPGCGSSSISGAPFHLRYTQLDGDSVGNRDNAIQSGAIVAPSETPTPTLTGTPTVTSTLTSSPTATDTPVSSPTATSTPTITPTATNTSINSPTATDTPVSSPTATSTPTITPTATNTSINSPTATDTPVSSPTATNTPAGTPTVTTTGTATLTPTGTPTLTSSSTATPTSTPTGTLIGGETTSTPTGTPTATPTTACGNGTIDAGESCDPPGTLQPPNDNPCRADCTFCGDVIINGSETCDDGNDIDADSCRNDCAGALRKDPATIRFRSGTRITDQLKVRGGFTSDHSIDAATLIVGVRLTNADGLIYGADLPAGSMVRVGSRFDFRDRDAKYDPVGGIARFWLKPGRNGRYHTGMIAYGDLSSATLPEMTVELHFGQLEYTSGGTWMEKTYGWKLTLPWLE